MTSVLLVDDQPAIRVGLRTILESAGIDVQAEAGDGDEAVRLAQRLPPDVILMDLRMPGTDGIAATRRIREVPALAQTRVIILTTFDGDPNVLAALRAGADGFLGKSASPDEIIDAVQKAACGDVALSQNAQRALLRHLAEAGEPSTPDPKAAALAAELTPRERDVVIAAAQGHDNDAIATQLFISPLTVKTHLNRAMVKLRARDRGQLVATAYRIGLIPRPG
ncbi:MAG TPA: response regulator transcription factor [Micromonosporaceae bacterium]|jgi:DNA-binding NarL/FixJ family response regulator